MSISPTSSTLTPEGTRWQRTAVTSGSRTGASVMRLRGDAGTVATGCAHEVHAVYAVMIAHFLDPVQPEHYQTQSGTPGSSGAEGRATCGCSEMGFYPSPRRVVTPSTEPCGAIGHRVSLAESTERPPVSGPATGRGSHGLPCDIKGSAGRLRRATLPGHGGGAAHEAVDDPGNPLWTLGDRAATVCGGR